MRYKTNAHTSDILTLSLTDLINLARGRILLSGGLIVKRARLHEQGGALSRFAKAIGWGLVAMACPGAFSGSGALRGPGVKLQR